jgi:hypothetical protein
LDTDGSGWRPLEQELEEVITQQEEEEEQEECSKRKDRTHIH